MKAKAQVPMRWYVFILLQPVCFAKDLFMPNRVMLNDTDITGVVCLDGSPAGWFEYRTLAESVNMQANSISTFKAVAGGSEPKLCSQGSKEAKGPAHFGPRWLVVAAA
jgi:hypothetical protein